MKNREDLTHAGELFDQRYLLIRPLSADGATADVWLALDINTIAEDLKGDPIDISNMTDEEIEALGLVVAIKIYRPQNALDIEGEQRFRDEYMIVFNCHHANLIHPTQFSIFKDIPYLVLPYCHLGSSENLIGQKLTDNEIWKYIHDVSSGLAYLHSCGIIHQDIKPANILLDDTNHYAITDFGISSQKNGVHGYYKNEEKSGTFAYMAPERFLEDADPIPPSDIWAFGATLFEILTAKVPFGEGGGQMQMKNNTAVPQIKGISAHIQRLITACLDKDPQKRPTAQQIAEAARARQFPFHSHHNLPIPMAIVAVVAVLVVTLTLILVNHHNQRPLYSSPQPIYAAACRQLDSSSADTLKAGMKIMDSLSNAGYIPAIYQMAFTYGWYSDSVSVKRKLLLGIEMDTSCLPKADVYSNKAVALFTKILELNDSAYADINANAAYRLACYYVMPNSIYKPNYPKGRRYLLKSKYWSEKAADQELLNKINKGLSTFIR